MEFIRTPFENLVIIKPKKIKDNRGYFEEIFLKKELNKFIDYNFEFSQENESLSKFGVLRGLHYQNSPYQQSKLIKVLDGEILDVVVDLRRNSKTYGKSFSVRLSKKNNLQLFIPRGFAHGYVSLTKFSRINYKVDNYYSKKLETGIKYDDPKLNINWIVKKNNLIISDRDKTLPNFANQFL
jgi:dTDP-4-dehydrorhamnose 3,5-epimerase